ncbi:hypothetical protein LNP04_09030 [Chryseobacterium sp. C-71]|uniref:hypothetical protein n=1 Tax=Chryseobacterium sp. C-71 TaxID=2893882 RepID=UPI001E563CBB|nr:hypothetical protein [Chryseobacterium sp. C-71]UFH33824.1 hypothetical protein LNP04_09030 [Chryseobacterium sp. C-71]
MKITLYFSLILIILLSCNVKQKHLEHYLSPGVENMKLFPSNKLDSLKINTFYTNAEKCLKAGGLYCDVCNPEVWANFKNGMYNFRIELFKNLKLPKNAKEGESRVRVIIGTHDNLEKIEILKYTDEKTREAIEHVFRLKELNAWTSAKIYGIHVKEQFEISVFVIRK